MIEITGKYTKAIIHTDIVEPDVIKQVQQLCNHSLFKDKNIAIMPDTHPGKGTVVGLTTQITDNLIPSLLGTDIGCGILAVKLKKCATLNDYVKLDKVIYNNIPFGGEQRKTPAKYLQKDNILNELSIVCKNINSNIQNYMNYIGTLGGGNHFISIEKGNTGTYLLIHTGSRTLGKDVYLYYADLALKQNCYQQRELKQLSYLDKVTSEQYKKDVKIVQHFAEVNRRIIAQIILKEMNWKSEKYIDIPHNYMDDYHIRKGAIYRSKNECFIPISPADGTLIVKDNFDWVCYDEWNHSAPHGAGRIMSRQDAKEKLNMKDFKNAMEGIYTSCIKTSTLDESPMVYKNINDIKENLKDVCEIIDILQPKYNFKAN